MTKGGRILSGGEYDAAWENLEINQNKLSNHEKHSFELNKREQNKAGLRIIVLKNFNPMRRTAIEQLFTGILTSVGRKRG